MSQIYHRSIKGIEIRLGKYADDDFAIYIGSKLYASIDCWRDAYIMYNSITEETVNHTVR